MRCLIVDDSRTSRLTLAAAVRNATPHAVAIQEAPDPDAGLRAFDEGCPDVVFLDMCLDDRGGQGGLLAIRAMLARRPEARIVMVTSLPATHPDLVAAIGEGAFGHLAKPVRTDTVRKLLHELEAETGRLGRIR